MAHIQIRIDYDDKKSAEKVLTVLGLNFSSAIKLFLKQVVREQKLPFEVSAVSSVSSNESLKNRGETVFSSRKIS